MLEINSKAQELNRVVKDLIQAIRKEQKDRQPRRPRDDDGTQYSDARKRPRKQTSSGAEERQVEPIRKLSLRKDVQENPRGLIKPTVRSSSVRQSDYGSASNSPRTAKTADLASEEDQNNGLDVSMPLFADRVLSSTENDQKDNTGYENTLEEQDSPDLFPRDMIKMFNECIGEDPGGPSGFLGAIDLPEVPTIPDGREENPAVIEIDSEASTEILKGGSVESPDETTRDATVTSPQDTLDRLLPGVKLNDTTILDVLSTTLPESAEPLIARWAIRDFPKSGLAQTFVTSSGPPPMLRHKPVSKYLFLAYNVIYGTLDCDKDGIGNHWILIVVDFLDCRVHVFGTEHGLEPQAEVLALNIGTFVNNYRSERREDAILWSEPRCDPVSQP